MKKKLKRKQNMQTTVQSSNSNFSSNSQQVVNNQPSISTIQNQSNIKYQPFTMEEVLQKMQNNTYMLPSIQRKFVWKEKQITNLFDSLMLGYPIGTILVWKENNNVKITNQYYKFIQEVNLDDVFISNKSSSPALCQNTELVLDGQQRLSSINIAMQGYITNNSQIKKYLYFDYNQPIKSNKNGYNAVCYNFKFLTDQNGQSKGFFKVSDILDPIVKNDVQAKSSNFTPVQLENLQRLYEVVYNEKSFFVYTLPQNSSIYDILSVFARLNNGGTPLSNSNLIFSFISSSWQNGRQKFDDLLTNVNAKGFRFLVDYVTKVALITGGNDISLKVERINKNIVDDIIMRWDKIARSIELTTDLLKDKFYMNSSHVISENAIIPINYYIYNKLLQKHKTSQKELHDIKINDILQKNEIEEIRKFLVLIQLKKVFTNASDIVAGELCKYIDVNILNNKHPNFTFKAFDNFSYSGKEVKADANFINDLFKLSKGSPKAYLALSLLYNGINLSPSMVDQDHLHPKSEFTGKKFKKNFAGLSPDKQKFCKEQYNLLANLHFLDNSDNKIKNKTPLKQWLQQNNNHLRVKCLPYQTEINKNSFEPFDLSNFIKFIEERRTLMEDEYKKIFS